MTGERAERSPGAKPELPLTFAPRRPTLMAFGILTVFIVILCLPMFAGRLLASPGGDLIWGGLPTRWFAANEFRRTGSLPMWNPYIFGGLPFVGAMHGDIFYPTAWLRLLLPIDTAMNLGFAIHLVLAGWFAYLFLRTIQVSWTGSLTGALAYQLSGSVASMVQPGHDGKLFVSALLPLLLLGLVVGIRQRRPEGYGLLAFITAMGLISPHFQMMQYALIFAGLFTLWLAFGDPQRPATAKARVAAVALALGAVILAFGAGMIQLYPFIKYMPYAARVAGARGWEYATSWAMPPENIVDWLVSDFTGMARNGYWGSNFTKLNSEYLGAGTLVLAAVGAAAPSRRKLIWFLGWSGLLFVLVSLGGHTPFYHLWYAIVPGAKVTRAAGMAFYIPTFIVACFAGFGVERLERGGGRGTLKIALIGAGLLLVLAVSGALGRIAESIALGFGHDQLAWAHAGPILLSGLRAAIIAAGVAVVGLLCLGGRVRAAALALLLTVLIGVDQSVNAFRYFAWSQPASVLYADDNITTRLAKASPPYRVLDISELVDNRGYPVDFLMAKGVPNVLGHHGNELDAYDKLLGGKNEWKSVLNPRIWDMLGVRYIVYGAPLPISRFHLVTRMVTAAGEENLYEADSATAAPYARVVPAAIKVRAEQIPATVLLPGFDPYRIVLLDESAAGVSPPHIDSLPPPMAARATVTHWEPGAMTVRMNPAPEHDGYLVVSENWFTDWRATVDGRSVAPLRGQGTLLTVPVSRGSREVTLNYSRDTYRTGRLMTLLSFAGIAAWLFVPVFLRRRVA